MMKFMPFLFFIASFQLFGQSRVDWAATVDECKVLVLTADMDEGWHIYSQFQSEDEGPVPTRISVDFGYGKVISASEPKAIRSYDENYGGEVIYFEDEVDFRVALPEGVEGEIIVKIVFMTCNEEGCLPPEMKEIKLRI